jgi:hypothetical protein
MKWNKHQQIKQLKLNKENQYKKNVNCNSKMQNKR